MQGLIIINLDVLYKILTCGGDQLTFFIFNTQVKYCTSLFSLDKLYIIRKVKALKFIWHPFC